MQERPLSKPPDSIRGGKTIAGKYRLESMLGTGAMGTVWVATHSTLGSKVAVKLVSQDFARSEEAQARFLAEAKAAAALRSRYVVQMFDSGVTEDGEPYIVMEYLRGESLEERINRGGRLPLDQVVRVIGQVAKGLQRAHASNIVHRDLKPANIFLATTEDGDEVAKILDFGIAKMDHDDRDYKATATGVIMGTPLYMSPEQARGLRTVGCASDVYSLGMVTYCALVGDVPFHAESFGDLVYMVCTQELPAMDRVAPWLPATMDAWFRRACHKDQTQRFQSTEEMYEALLVAAQLSSPRPGLQSMPDTALSSQPNTPSGERHIRTGSATLPISQDAATADGTTQEAVPATARVAESPGVAVPASSLHDSAAAMHATVLDQSQQRYPGAATLGDGLTRSKGASARRGTSWVVIPTLLAAVGVAGAWLGGVFERTETQLAQPSPSSAHDAPLVAQHEPAAQELPEKSAAAAASGQTGGGVANVIPVEPARTSTAAPLTTEDPAEHTEASGAAQDTAARVENKPRPAVNKPQSKPKPVTAAPPPNGPKPNPPPSSSRPAKAEDKPTPGAIDMGF
jgi:serine/threonine-protein kinase